MDNEDAKSEIGNKLSPHSVEGQDVTYEDYKKAKSSGLSFIKTLTVTYDHFKAELSVEYWWSNDGDVLHGYARQYRVTSNGNNSGNITFGVHGRSPDQIWERELTGSAVQDGEWHELTGGGKGGWVGVVSKRGKLYFHYTFDRSTGGDPSADTELTVVFPN
ncbi:hypothetical protein LOY70_23695 [Pseudomonas sp. B21-054]|uniref:hypothetical protein n=1 Tax=Pseudomonas sp. B21-054 TaxID=2895494 RepID=UPI0022327854|nr:hypothetical protein [Pseudomonas sp. B21-054]UZE16855.1 hypothetical protein LOY70_23695 [Pseudomonas sp. B21-054]